MNIVLIIILTLGVLVTTLGVTAIVGATRLNLTRERSKRSLKRMHCSCGHPRAIHDLTNDRCHEQYRRPYYDDFGNRNGHKYVTCQCHHYDGAPSVASLDAFTTSLTVTREDL